MTDIEIEDIPYEEETEEFEEENERMPYSLVTRTSKHWQSNLSGELNKQHTECIFETENRFGFPEIESTPDFEPEELIAFIHSKHQKKPDKNKTVHFFLDDYKIECIWSKTNRYIKLLQFYNGVLTPTFSIYSNQPYALNIYNIYRSRWCAKYFKEIHGMKILIDARWGDEKSFEFAFSGITKHTPVILNTVGTKMLDNRQLFIAGFEEMMRQLEPNKLFVYGEYRPVEFEKYFDSVKYYNSFWAQRRAAMHQIYEEEDV